MIASACHVAIFFETRMRAWLGDRARFARDVNNHLEERSDEICPYVVAYFETLLACKFSTTTAHHSQGPSAAFHR